MGKQKKAADSTKSVMSSWRLKYTLIPGADANNSKLTLFIAILGAVSLFYILLVWNFDKTPDAKANWIPKRKLNREGVDDPIFFNPNKATTRAKNAETKIAIVMIVTNDTNPENYDAAIKSVQCYSKIHNYAFVLAVDTDFNCSHQDKFFRRHCAAAKILPLYDAILFLDADIGIINPKRKIEEFMSDGIDVTFYDRFYNWEIMAGSYIARNTKYSSDLLNEFADYEFKLPKSFHGTDNGALHIFLAEKLFPEMDVEIEICRQVYTISVDYADLFTYEACIRAIMGSGTDFGRVRILRKGTGWARDGWLTTMLWHPELDFMFHGLKMNQLKETPAVPLKPHQMGRSQWYNFLLGPIDLNKCSPSNSTWSYDPRLIGNKTEILGSLKDFRRRVAIDQVNSYSRMTGVLSRWF